MKYYIAHTTVYTYSEPVTLCHNIAHLVPRHHPFQRVARVQFRVEPRPEVFTERDDFFGNRATYFTVQKQHRRLEVHVESEVTVSTAPRPRPAETPGWEYVRDLLKVDLVPANLEAFEYCFDSPHVRRSPELAAYAAPSFPRARPIMAGLLDLNARIHREFAYTPNSTDLSTSVADVLRMRRGVCQDFAHLMIGCLRSLGLPARYVSGYLRTEPPPGQPRLVGADASHAWIAAYIPGMGWYDFDPTNNSVAGETHIVLAWGRDYSDVSPIRGVLIGGGRQTIAVGVTVAPQPG